ncbi:hypothetical protein AAFF_G00198480 [Aldrovandia affinis]|uniref:SWIM-type domain-containing protein n=1 Tax=Aldrovandia affinis TaxID=143900 RepID=A0AAD7W5R5_9TELE|nr:hypothetical protein AAFF_G00198480 [Aldrovandia affinis]
MSDSIMVEYEYSSFLKRYQEETKSKFIIKNITANFNDKEWQPPTGIQKVYWEWKKDNTPSIPFSGVPFIFVGFKSMMCHQGKDNGAKKKRQYAEAKSKETTQDHSFRKGRFLLQDTKKVGCPAEVHITRICRFPAFKLDDNRERARKAAAVRLREALKRDPIVWEIVYIVKTPAASAHVGHPAIRPALTRRRVYPTDKDIRNVIAKAREEGRQSKIDLQDLVESHKRKCPTDNIHLRLNSGKEDLLFCYQSEWQQKILQLYGKDVCLLDATYRTAPYASPLFFLYVRTNVCYVVAGVFVVQHERTEAVKEALTVFKEWNKNWSPAHFLVDYSEVEIQAVESTFEGAQAVLCDFHRERAWVEWARKPADGIEDQGALLKMLRAIAAADTTETFHQSVDLLTNSSVWRTNSMLRNWFSTTWLAETKRWVAVFRDESLNVAVTANNGAKRQSETLKFRFLDGYKESTLTDMVTVVMNSYVPYMQKKYTELNVRCSSGYKRYNKSVPAFLNNRPKDMVKHVLQRMDTSLGAEDIVSLGGGVFRVKSETKEGAAYTVDFGRASSTMPSCQCQDWKQQCLPCKHFCAVFRSVPGWTWNELAETYRDQPLFVLDPDCFCPGEHRQVSSEPASTVVTDLPHRRKSCKNLLMEECISTLKNIMESVYLLDNETTLLS